MAEAQCDKSNKGKGVKIHSFLLDTCSDITNIRYDILTDGEDLNKQRIKFTLSEHELLLG